MTAEQLNRRVAELVEGLDAPGVLPSSREQMVQEIQALSLASIARTLNEETKIGGAFKR